METTIATQGHRVQAGEDVALRLVEHCIIIASEYRKLVQDYSRVLELQSVLDDYKETALKKDYDRLSELRGLLELKFAQADTSLSGQVKVGRLLTEFEMLTARCVGAQGSYGADVQEGQVTLAPRAREPFLFVTPMEASSRRDRARTSTVAAVQPRGGTHGGSFATGRPLTQKEKDLEAFYELKNRIIDIETQKNDKKALLDIWQQLEEDYGARIGKIVLDEKNCRSWLKRRTDTLDQVRYCISECWEGDKQAYCESVETPWPILHPRYKCTCVSGMLPADTSKETDEEEGSNFDDDKDAMPARDENRGTTTEWNHVKPSHTFNQVHAAKPLNHTKHDLQRLFQGFKARIGAIEQTKTDKAALLKEWCDLRDVARENPAIRRATNGAERWIGRRIETLASIEICINSCWKGDKEAYCSSSIPRWPFLVPNYRCTCGQAVQAVVETPQVTQPVPALEEPSNAQIDKSKDSETLDVEQVEETIVQDQDKAVPKPAVAEPAESAEPVLSTAKDVQDEVIPSPPKKPKLDNEDEDSPGSPDASDMPDLLVV